MSILIAVRHGRSTSNTAGTLAGRSPGVDLDETGRDQARKLGERLRDVRLAAVVSSPMQRCQQTVELALEAAGVAAEVTIDERVIETDYGSWSGKLLKDLAQEPLWQTVQHRPQEARFPGGEAMVDVRDRMVNAVLDWNSRLAATDVWLLASHGDPLAALLNWTVGSEFAHVQRLGVDPASASVIMLPEAQTTSDGEPASPRVIAVNTVEGPLARWCAPPAEQSVGGGLGNSADPATPSTDH